MSDTEIADAATDLRKAAAHLTQLLRKYCPGPHKPVQHRDHKPPWCNACRRTSDGWQI